MTDNANTTSELPPHVPCDRRSYPRRKVNENCYVFILEQVGINWVRRRKEIVNISHQGICIKTNALPIRVVTNQKYHIILVLTFTPKVTRIYHMWAYPVWTDVTRGMSGFVTSLMERSHG